VLLKFLMVFAPLPDGRAAAQQDGPTLIAGAKDMMASSPSQTRGRPGRAPYAAAHTNAHTNAHMMTLSTWCHEHAGGAECHEPAPQPGARDMRGIGAMLRARRTGIYPRQPANTNPTCDVL
jgi:hypothetical protein